MFKLYINGKLIGAGNAVVVSDMRYSQQREACFVDETGEVILAELKYPEIISINRDGVRLKGFEVTGFKSTGEILSYQEWWIPFQRSEMK